MMHTYKKRDDTWSVGYWLDLGGICCWRPLRDFEKEKDAAAYVNYLNGGDGYPPRHGWGPSRSK